jgi:hypothetical protein
MKWLLKSKYGFGYATLALFLFTFESWHSEFLQLLWQVCGLAYLLYVGSPQSKTRQTARKQSSTQFSAA